MLVRIVTFIFCCLLMCSAVAESTDEETVSDANEPGWVSKTLWYVPNRVMDLLDIFRVRAKVGPGIEAGVRFTDVFSFYGGASNAMYIGLPGSRGEPRIPAILGYQQTKGVVLMGLDATDVRNDPPDYEYSEIGASVHVVGVGLDAGFSVVELVDFLGGWFGVDFRHDDFPRTQPKQGMVPGSYLAPRAPDPEFPLDHRPDKFPGLRSRLNYLEKNVPILVQGQLHQLDRSLAGHENAVLEQPPVTGLWLGLYYDFVSGPNGKHELDPKLKIKVELPNFENQFSVFIQNSYDDDLPGVDQSDRDDKGWSVGAEQQMDKWNLYTDVGIHTKWEPVVFLRFSWRPNWEWGEWHMGFNQRFFWENEEQFGQLTQLRAYRWMGDSDKWIFRTLTAGRLSENTNGYEWQQTLSFGHINSLRQEDRRGENLSLNDALNCFGVNTSVFGQDQRTKQYQTTFVYRKRLHEDFVVLELEPGLEWRDENQWTTQYRFSAGILFFF